MDIRNNMFWQEAFAEGFGQGQSTLLHRLLETRFGPLPTWVLERLTQSDRTTLEEAAIRLLNATRLEEVFLAAPTV